MLADIPPEIWTLIESYLTDSNFLKFLIWNQKNCNLQLDIPKLKYRWHFHHPQIHWLPPSSYYPNVRLGIPYLEYELSNNSKTKKIEYLSNTIVESIS